MFLETKLFPSGSDITVYNVFLVSIEIQIIVTRGTVGSGL